MLVVSAVRDLLKEKRSLLTAIGIFAVCTLFTAPLFSMIPAIGGGQGFIEEAFAQDEVTQEVPTGEEPPTEEPPEPRNPGDITFLSGNSPINYFMGEKSKNE
jgi:hypothetical protein